MGEIQLQRMGLCSCPKGATGGLLQLAMLSTHTDCQDWIPCAMGMRCGNLARASYARNWLADRSQGSGHFRDFASVCEGVHASIFAFAKYSLHLRAKASVRVDGLFWASLEQYFPGALLSSSSVSGSFGGGPASALRAMF